MDGTGSESGVTGYYVSRSTAPTGPFTRVSGLIAPTGDGGRYLFADHIRTSLGRLLVYRIEVERADATVEFSGTTSLMVPGPKVKKLGDQ